MIRILHVLQTPRAEGTPNLVLDWLAIGHDRLWQGVLVLNREPADLSTRLRSAADAYEEHHLFQRRWRKYPGMAATTFWTVRRMRPDVVVCWTTGFGNWVCAGAAAGGCRRLIVHAGNPAGHTFYERWMTRYMIWPMKFLGCTLICCSDFVRHSYKSTGYIFFDSFETVPNCVRVTRFVSRLMSAQSTDYLERNNQKIGLIVANLELARDFLTLIRSVPLIVERYKRFRLLIVGRGSRLPELRAEAARLGCDDHIKFLGARQDVPELMASAHIFIFPTLQEGFGTVLLEALLARLPIVANDVPACRELLTEGRRGVLVPPGDIKALACAVCDTLDDPPPDSHLDAAQSYASQFTAERMVQKYLQIARLDWVP